MKDKIILGRIIFLLFSDFKSRWLRSISVYLRAALTVIFYADTIYQPLR